MTTLVAAARPHAPTRSARTDLDITAAPAATPASQPAVSCPACGLPATVEWRDMTAGTSGPVVHLKMRCPRGTHWFLVTEEGL
jgi:hypothetical protein